MHFQEEFFEVMTRLKTNSIPDAEIRVSEMDCEYSKNLDVR